MTGSAQAAEELAESSALFDTLPFTSLLLDLNVPMVVVDYLIGAVNRIYEIITSSGVQILIFLAALQSIPSSMYEVARLEGATSYEIFWKITFPMVSPLILTNVIYTHDRFVYEQSRHRNDIQHCFSVARFRSERIDGMDLYAYGRPAFDWDRLCRIQKSVLLSLGSFPDRDIPRG